MANELNEDEQNENESISQIENAISESGIAVPESQEVEVESDSTHDDDNATVNEMNQFFKERYAIYQDLLGPELKENEELKRKQKKKLMKNIFRLLKYQFIATYCFVFVFILMIALNYVLHISENVIVEIAGFLKFYITSIVAELIAILFFIVKNVFDRSIYDLFKNFDKTKKEDGDSSP